jgi:arginase
MSRTLSLIGAPTSAGAHCGGQEGAPTALRRAGLVAGLRQAGVDVTDAGDISAWRWRPDQVRPRAQNLGKVLSAIGEVTTQVESARRRKHFALVLGGDCTVELGTVLGQLHVGARLGLLYFDMHADMNVPSSVPGGALDWMGVAHLLGCPGADPELAAVARLEPEQVIVLGHRLDQATAFEKEQITRLGVRTVPIDEVAATPAQAAMRALSLYDDRVDTLAVHFDVDVIDFTDAPLSEHTGRNIGLKQDTAFSALRTVLADPRVTSLTITELNPDHGEPDGTTIRKFADALSRTFAPAGV